MPKKESAEIGRKAREFVIKKYDQKVIGKKIEKILDDMPTVNYDFEFSNSDINPNYSPPDIKDNLIWLQDIYKNIFNLNLKQSDSPIKYWAEIIEKEGKESVLRKLKTLAENEKREKEYSFNFENKLKGNSKSERIAVVCEEDENQILYASAITKSLKEIYPNHKIHFICKPEFFQIIKGNKNIDQKIPIFEDCLSQTFMEGDQINSGFFDVCYIIPSVYKNKNLHHNGKDIVNA